MVLALNIDAAAHHDIRHRADIGNAAICLQPDSVRGLHGRAVNRIDFPVVKLLMRHAIGQTQGLDQRGERNH